MAGGLFSGLSRRLFIEGTRRAIGGAVSVESGRSMGTVTDNKESIKLDLFKAIVPVSRQLERFQEVSKDELIRLNNVVDKDMSLPSRELQSIIRDVASTTGDELTLGMTDRVVSSSANQAVGGEILIAPGSEFHKTNFDLFITAQHETAHELMSGNDRLSFTIMDFKTCRLGDSTFQEVSEKFINHMINDLAWNTFEGTPSPSSVLESLVGSAEKELKALDRPDITTTLLGYLKGKDDAELQSMFEARLETCTESGFPIIENGCLQEIVTTTQQEVTLLFNSKKLSDEPILETDIRMTLEENSKKFEKSYVNGVHNTSLDAADKESMMSLMREYSDALVSKLMDQNLVISDPE